MSEERLREEVHGLVTLRFHADGTVDEVLVRDRDGGHLYHLEQMDEGQFWMRFDPTALVPLEKSLVVNLGPSGALHEWNEPGTKNPALTAIDRDNQQAWQQVDERIHLLNRTVPSSELSIESWIGALILADGLRMASYPPPDEVSVQNRCVVLHWWSPGWPHAIVGTDRRVQWGVPTPEEGQ